jgi:hypothetical protein
MSTDRGKKRPRDEDSESDQLDSSTSDSDALDKGKKRTKQDPSNTEIVRSTIQKKLQSASRGSIGLPAVRALLAQSGSLSKFGAASRETNSGLRRKAGVRKASNSKGKEKAAR